MTTEQIVILSILIILLITVVIMSPPIQRYIRSPSNSSKSSSSSKSSRSSKEKHFPREETSTNRSMLKTQMVAILQKYEFPTAAINTIIDISNSVISDALPEGLQLRDYSNDSIQASCYPFLGIVIGVFIEHHIDNPDSSLMTLLQNNNHAASFLEQFDSALNNFNIAFEECSLVEPIPSLVSYLSDASGSIRTSKNRSKSVDPNDPTGAIRRSSKWKAFLSFSLCYGSLDGIFGSNFSARPPARLIGLLVGCIVSVCVSGPYGKRYVRLCCLCVVGVAVGESLGILMSSFGQLSQDRELMDTIAGNVVVALVSIFARAIIGCLEKDDDLCK